MGPWLESCVVALLALLGVWLGRWFSHLRRPYWTIGYFIPLALIGVYVLANHEPALSFVPPISWLVMGRNKFASIGIVATMVLTTPLSRIQPARTRRLISLLMALVVFSMSIWPFLAPAFNRSYLASLKTQVDANGVCLQSTSYNCGPAAAVTALRSLGFAAEEGEIAILAHTSLAAGTPPDVLAEALQERYAKDGLVCEFRVFKSLDELRRAGPTLAVIRYSFWVDHYVAVLGTKGDEVLAGDPASGLVSYTTEEFVQRWRHLGVVLKRKAGH